jgi:hypothetical protein
LEYVTIAFYFLLPIFLLTLLGVLGVPLTQRLVPVEQRKPHNTAIGIIYGGLYVLFGVIVGFTSLLVLNNYNAARVAVQSETADLARIYELAQQLPESKREEIQGLAESYARVVVEQEWPLLPQGRFSPRAQELSDDLRSAIQEFEPSTTTEQIIYTQELNAVSDLDEDRETRLLDARLRLPDILWVALVGLTICMLIFSWLLGVEAIRLHMLGVSVLMAGIALVLCTIFLLERPYGTVLRVQPQPFEVWLRAVEGTSQVTRSIEGTSRLVSMPEANYPTY